jgi:DNA repair protein RadA/Sms
MQSCERCGTEFSSDKSKCPDCGNWQVNKKVDLSSIVRLSDVDDVEVERCSTNIDEFDTVFGGGLVPGTVFMIGGAPGAGKSTMMLQITEAFEKIGYIAAEESASQIKSRAKRLELNDESMNNIWVIDALGGNDNITEVLESIKVDLLILDSLQGFVGLGEGSNDRSVEMLRLMKSIATDKDIPVIVLEHINKDGDLAGLMTLQHFVDGTFLLTVDLESGERSFKSVKNRHGAAPIEELFEMSDNGLFPAGPENDDDSDDDESDDDEDESLKDKLARERLRAFKAKHK